MLLSAVKASSKDVKALNFIMHASKAHWGYDKDFMEAFMDKFAMTTHYLAHCPSYFISHNDTPIGFFTFSIKQKTCELDNIFLLPTHIHQGFGRSAWQLCVKTATSLGYNTFTLLADPNANGFYEHMGCIKIDERPSPMGKSRITTVYRFTW